MRVTVGVLVVMDVLVAVSEFLAVGVLVAVTVLAPVGVLVVVGAFGDMWFVESLGKRNKLHAVVVNAGG